jgi:uncharacterized membrane protein
MALRSVRERAYQTLAYEAGGLAIATPLYMLLFGAGAVDSLTLMLVLSLAVMAWAGLHNSVFDWLEWRIARRMASNRPQVLRAVHAVSLEASAVLVTMPLAMWLGGLGFWQVAVFNAGMTATYVLWGYAFHLVWDRFRPVVAAVGPQAAGAVAP